MADKLPPRRESSSVEPNVENNTGPTWREVFGGAGTTSSGETVACRMHSAISQLTCLTAREREVVLHYLEHLDDKRRSLQPLAAGDGPRGG